MTLHPTTPPPPTPPDGGTPESGLVDVWEPEIAVYESRDEVRVIVQLPGVTRDAVQVRVASGILEIAGVRERAGPGQLTWDEPRTGRFRRCVPLPPGSLPGDPRAHLEDGILEVRIRREPV